MLLFTEISNRSPQQKNKLNTIEQNTNEMAHPQYMHIRKVWQTRGRIVFAISPKYKEHKNHVLFVHTLFT